MQRLIRRNHPLCRSEQAVAEQIEPLLRSCLDESIAVTKMTVWSTGAHSGSTRGFIEGEALRTMFGNQPAGRGNQCLFQVSVVVAVSGELGVRRPTAHEWKLRATGSAINHRDRPVRVARGAPGPRWKAWQSVGRRVGAG